MGDVFVMLGKLLGQGVFAPAARLWIRVIFRRHLWQLGPGAKVGAVFLSIPLTGVLCVSPLATLILWMNYAARRTPALLLWSVGFTIFSALLITVLALRDRRIRPGLPKR